MLYGKIAVYFLPRLLQQDAKFCFGGVLKTVLVVYR